ncbi:MAG: GT-D fold domain-containing protein [Phycisphaerae bacterium]|nr:GT-D fold domain-containing protein [Phycisphaerae bacterium]
MILRKIEKELARFKKRLFYSSKAHKQLEKANYLLDNMPYEMFDKITNADFSVPLPIIKTAEQTVDKILEDKCSLTRFGDGEFVLMTGGRINYQPRNSELAVRLKEVLGSDLPNLLIALPPCFGDLSHFLPPVANFWRKWAVRKRELIYSYLDMNRVYYDAFFSRAYIQNYKTDEHYIKCSDYYAKVKKIWQGRDIVICEGDGTRFGMFNDLLDGAKSVSRILCPPRNAYAKYDEILSAFDDIDKDKLVLIALGPTATVLSYDLCIKGFQAIDTGAFDIDYEWFLRKETELGVPIDYKYVDSGKAGRKCQPLDDPEYKSQIMKKINLD